MLHVSTGSSFYHHLDSASAAESCEHYNLHCTLDVQVQPTQIPPVCYSFHLRPAGQIQHRIFNCSKTQGRPIHTQNQCHDLMSAKSPETRVDNASRICTWVCPSALTNIHLFTHSRSPPDNNMAVCSNSVLEQNTRERPEAQRNPNDFFLQRLHDKVMADIFRMVSAEVQVWMDETREKSVRKMATSFN